MLLPKWADSSVRAFLESRGYVLVRSADDKTALARRKRILDTHSIDLVIDVGANIGQYGHIMRRLGYAGRIHSFEPMSAAWSTLQNAMSEDPRWDGTHAGLADRVGAMTLHVAGNSISSSVLPMLPIHERNAPDSRYIKDETIAMSTLDQEFPKIKQRAANIWLKLDVQGFESKVLQGAECSLPEISVIQSELSLTRLYGNQVTYLALCAQLEALGFHLIGIEPGFQDKTNGNLLQFDGIFERR